MLRFRLYNENTVHKQLSILSNRHFHIFPTTSKHNNRTKYANIKPNKYILSCKLHSNNINSNNNSLISNFSASIKRIIGWINPRNKADNDKNNSPSMTTAIANSSSPYVVSTESQNKTIRLAFLANTTICVFKLLTYLMTNSSAMFSEFVHTFVDTVNQGILIIGARQATRQPDYKFQSGYGKSPFFWSLISAMNIFWVGFIFSVYHSMAYPSVSIDNHLYTWAVLGFSLLLDGAVLKVSLAELKKTKPKDMSMVNYIKHLKNPLVMATVLEDIAAVIGVGIAGIGIYASQLTNNLMFDHIASISIGLLLGLVSFKLIKMNYKFLLGYSVNPEIQARITNIIKSRPSIQQVYSVRCEWIGTNSFVYKAEIDFDGGYFAKQLHPQYTQQFKQAASDDNNNHKDTTNTNTDTHLQLLLSEYAERITTAVEEEVVSLELEIQSQFPEAIHIELEPASDWAKSIYSKSKQKLKVKQQQNNENDSVISDEK